jgi:endoglucanase
MILPTEHPFHHFPPLRPGQHRPLAYRGVNIASGAFARELFPTPQYVDYYARAGMNIVRLPFHWRWLVPKGEIDRNYLRRIVLIVERAQSLGVVALVEMHQMGHTEDMKGFLGLDDVPAFREVWRKIAAALGDRPLMRLGPMNEPHQDPPVWHALQQAAVEGIREAGFTGRLHLMPSGFNDYDYSRNGSFLLNTRDPLDNWVIEDHRYVDVGGAGQNYTDIVVGSGRGRIAGITKWAREHGKKLFLGEFGASGTPHYLAELKEQMDFLHENRDVWEGWTYWAGGPHWGYYPYTIEPEDLANPVDRPQMTLLRNYL